MSRLHLLLVTRPGIGGAAKHVRMICELIDKSAFDVTVACSSLESSEFPRDLAATGVRVFLVDMRREPHPSDAGAMWKIVKLLRKRHAGVVHAHTSKPGILARLPAVASGVPSLYTPHGFYFHYDIPAWKRAFYREAERFAGHWTSRLVCVTEEEARQAEEARLVARDRIVVLPNAVRLEECVARGTKAAVRGFFGVPDGVPLLVMVGRLAEPKDPFTLVRAVARLSKPAHILFAGEGPQRDAIARLTVELNLHGRIHLPGHRADVMDLVSAADVAVLSSKWEGLPFALLEAMALSVPVVATDISGCRDVLGGSGAGALVPPQDVDAMARELERFIGDPRLREDAGRRGRALIEEKYSADRWIRRLETIYRGAAGR